MRRIVLNESDLKHLIREAVEQGIKDKIKGKVKTAKKKIKKGWDNYKNWCEKALDAENPSPLYDDEIEESVRKSIKKMVKEAICEIEDDFQPDGYKGISNAGGYEIQLNNNGTARLKKGNQVSDWLEINFDGDGEPFIIDDDGDEHKLSDFMRKF